jgi:glycine/serine hydroxymethyltransferase
MREEQMATIGGLIHRVLVGRDDDAEVAAVRNEILDLCAQFKPY